MRAYKPERLLSATCRKWYCLQKKATAEHLAYNTPASQSGRGAGPPCCRTLPAAPQPRGAPHVKSNHAIKTSARMCARTHAHARRTLDTSVRECPSLQSLTACLPRPKPSCMGAPSPNFKPSIETPVASRSQKLHLRLAPRGGPTGLTAKGRDMWRVAPLTSTQPLATPHWRATWGSQSCRRRMGTAPATHRGQPTPRLTSGRR